MKTSSGPEPVRQHLNSFAIATILAVGLLAVAWPAAAEIVYTKVNVQMPGRGSTSYNLDLNNDGVTDFTFTVTGAYGCGFPNECFWFFYSFVETPASGNGAEGSPPTNLAKGDQIGPSQSFYGGTGTIESSFLGPISLKGYLGLSFQIDGETHYGWAKISVNMKTGVVTLVSYAYETIANMPINAGQF
jgi:hypothetical protein